MYKKILLVLLLFFILIGALWVFDNSKQDVFSEKIKISLREAGHQLLLTNKDSTSIVLPVLELDTYKYKISFEKNLAIAPKDLLPIIRNSFEKGSLPLNYIIEIIRCSDTEVAYSYEINNGKENSIIPCLGRKLEKDCYSIKVHFTNNTKQKPFFVIITLIMFVSLLFYLYNKKQRSSLKNEGGKESFITLGNFQFDFEQNRLLIDSQEINLSTKECELLTIFVANPNKIIKREELSKKVWEDKGVFVGRSLDTYISKLRKKFKEDDSIQLINIHGVGYKLKITKN